MKENTMNCPKCGKEMEKGEVSQLFYSRYGEKLFWAPEDFFNKGRIATRGAVKKAGGKIFPIGRTIFDDIKCAWYCKECELVVMDVSDKR